MIYRSPSRSQAGRAAVVTVVVLLVVVLVVIGVLRIISPGSSKTTNIQAASGPKRHLKFTFIAQGQSTAPFWSVVKHGADQAAEDMGVTVTYQAPKPYSAAAMSSLIDAAVATNPDGLVVSIPDCDGLSPAIQRAQLIGIAVVSINAGSDCAAKLGVLGHVGQDDYQSGLAAGGKLADQGARHVLCLNEGVGNPELDNRCRGINDALTKANGQSEVMAIDLTNPEVAQQAIQARLTQGSAYDAIMTLSPDSAAVALAALKELGQSGRILLATFDLSTPVLQAIQQGDILFAVDQQPYLQGYLPIVLLTLHKTNLSEVAAPIIPTGPDFVTKDNVTQIEQFVTAGTR
jgi:simple sugar transport system substrate-binding protein